MNRTDLGPGDIQVLRSQPLFRGLDGRALADLLSDARVRTYPRASLLFLQGEPADRFFVIFAGWVKLFRQSEAGEESVIAVFTAGESFAEAAIFDQATYPVSAVVVEEARMLVVPGASFIRRLSDNGAYALNMMASMSRHLRQLVQQVEQLSVRSSTERVAGFLARLCGEAEAGARVQLPLEKALIAGRLGMQPETFSRALARLRDQGVTSSGGEIVIRDVGSLRRIGGGAVADGRPDRVTRRALRA